MALSYQWYKDGVAIQGATSATYSKASAAVSDEGSYYCKVSNDYGSVNSNPATVDVLEYKIGYFAGTNVTVEDGEVTAWADTESSNPLIRSTSYGLPTVSGSALLFADSVLMSAARSYSTPDDWSIVVDCEPIDTYGTGSGHYYNTLFKGEDVSSVADISVQITLDGHWRIMCSNDYHYAFGDATHLAILGDRVKLTLTCDRSGTAKLYVGTTLVSTITSTLVDFPRCDVSVGGSENRSSGSPFGFMKEMKVYSMRIYDEELTAEQIAYA